MDSLNATPCIVVIRSDPAADSLIRDGAQMAFGKPEIRFVNGLEEVNALGSATPRPVYVLVNPPEEVASQLAGGEWGDEGGGTPLLILGKATGLNGFSCLPPERWEAAAVATALDLVVRLHTLERQLRRARGDLLTLSRRFIHDLRTPLGTIVSMSDLLMETLSETAPSEAALARVISDSADEQVQLMERVSTLITATVQTPNLETVNMGWALLQSLAQVEEQMTRRQAVIVQPDEWPEVFGVPQWLEQVWCELLRNCIDHGGTPLRIELGWSAGEGSDRFWIRDGGAGPAAEVVSRLFHPFHRRHEPNAPKGLGLTVVQRLIELQGGDCGHDPNLGPSAFYFTLPRRGGPSP